MKNIIDDNEIAEEKESNVIELKSAFMAVRKRLMKCADPIELEEEIRKLKHETGFTTSVLRQCAKECEKEKRDRKKESGKVNSKERECFEQQGPTEEWEEFLLYTKDREIRDCPANLTEILEKHPNWIGRIRKNGLTGNTEIDGIPLTEREIAEAAHWCGVTLRMTVKGLSNLFSTINLVASNHTYHPIRDWLDGLRWDGTYRIDSMFSDFLGSEQSAYSAYVARTMLCGMVARAYCPGCVVRQVPVIEGKEEIGKSRFVRHLGYPWSGEISSNVESGKQIAEDIRGFWVVELMEMDALNRASASRIKAFISQRNDHYRPAYGHVSEDHHRVAVFVGTINPNQALSLLRDDDQNTRFLPIVVTNYECDAFQSARDQLFAEAKAFYEAHKKDWWEQPEAARQIALPALEVRSVQDPWADRICEYLSGRDEVTIREILSDSAGLDIPTDRQTRSEATRVGLILHRIGWKVIRFSQAGFTTRTRVYGKIS